MVGTKAAALRLICSPVLIAIEPVPFFFLFLFFLRFFLVGYYCCWSSEAAAFSPSLFSSPAAAELTSGVISAATGSVSCWAPWPVEGFYFAGDCCWAPWLAWLSKAFPRAASFYYCSKVDSAVFVSAWAEVSICLMMIYFFFIIK